MVTNTYDMGGPRPIITTDRVDPRSESMFAQSSELYSRINKRPSKRSPWMIIAPAAVLVLVGGALLASTGNHPRQTATKVSTSTAAVTTPVIAPVAPVAKAPTLKVVPAPVKAAPARRTVPTAAPIPARAQHTTVSHAPVRTAVPPATTPVPLITQPTPVIAAPAPALAPTTVAPDTTPTPVQPAPDTTTTPVTPPGLQSNR